MADKDIADKDKGGFKQQLGSFADKLKNSKVNTPLQEVVPVAVSQSEKETKPEAQLNVWIPKDLLKQMKRHGLETDKTLKEIAILALELYLTK